jgi:hypothetical protein
MKKWHARLGDRDVCIYADDLRQAGEYVTLYANAKIVALLRMAQGDSIVEVQPPTP